jgi:uncharacterized membrane protein YcaP (DUF421 family)
MFFDDSQALIRVTAMALCGYAALIVLLRITGKRTLSKWNAFDLVITVALGSTFATLLLTQKVAYAEGVLALALLMGMQFAITWSSVRFKFMRVLIKAEPVFLFRDGTYLAQSMRRERVTQSEVRAAVRATGAAGMSSMAAVVLETDGSVSVIKKSSHSDDSALADVR